MTSRQPASPSVRARPPKPIFPALALRQRRDSPDDGAQPKPKRSLADIARRHQEEIEQVERDDFDRTILALQNIGLEEQNLSHGHRAALDKIAALESANVRLHVQLAEALNKASEYEGANYDLTDRVRELEDLLRESEDRERESARERGFLEKDLEYYRSHPSQLHHARSSSSLACSDVEMLSANSSKTIGEGSPKAAFASSLPTSLSSPFDVRDPVASSAPMEGSGPLITENATSALSADQASTSASPPRPVPRSTSRPSLASRSSKSSLHLQLLTQSIHPESKPLPPSPSGSFDRVSVTDEDAALRTSEALATYKKGKERRDRLRESKATASPGPDHAQLADEAAPIGAEASVPPRVKVRKDSPYPVQAAMTRVTRHLEGATVEDTACKSTTPTTAPPAHLLVQAAPARRQPFGASNAQPTVVTEHKPEGLLMEKIKKVLSRDEVKTFRKLVAEHDRVQSDLSEADFVRRLRSVFLPSSMKSGMAVKDKTARREVLNEFERQMKER